MMRSSLAALVCAFGVLAPWQAGLASSPVVLPSHPRMTEIHQEMPARGESVALLLARMPLREEDEITVETPVSRENTNSWTGTIAQLRDDSAQANAIIPPHPVVGTTLMTRSEEEFGREVWRYRYEYTWMLDAETSSYQWIVTQIDWKFVKVAARAP